MFIKKINIDYQKGGADDLQRVLEQSAREAEQRELDRVIELSRNEAAEDNEEANLARALAISMSEEAEGNRADAAVGEQETEVTVSEEAEVTDEQEGPNTENDGDLARALAMSEEEIPAAAMAQQVPLMMRPHILFLRLHAAADHNGALHEQADFIDYVRETCPQYQIDQRVFASLEDLVGIVTDPRYASIAFISILTHGEPHSITIGYGQLLMMGTPEFNFFCEMLRPKLLRNAQILLCACLTGFIEGISGDFDRSAVARGQERLIVNGDHQNFANSMAGRLRGHKILCTSFPQVAGELQLIVTNPVGRTVCNVENPDPLYIKITSNRQLMYVYRND